MTKLSYSAKFFGIPAREKAGKIPIYCRITVNRQKAEFSLNEFVDPKKWVDGSHEVKGNPELSATLKMASLDLKKYRDQILAEGRTPTAKEIKDAYLRIEEKSIVLLDYVKTYVDEVDQLTEYSKSTWKKYSTVKRHLTEFLESKKLTEITLKGFNHVRVHEFDFYLKTTAKLSVNTAAKYLKILKTIYSRAIKFGKTDKNPFDGTKFKFERTNREFLTQHELDNLSTKALPNDSLERVRDLFLFSCYTGLRFIDVGKLTHKNIIQSNKKYWIEIKEIEKTGDSLRIPLLDKAREIVNKYKSEAEITGQLLPLRSNQKVNSYLKVVADLCEIDKHLTFHMARHTFATTVTLSNNIPIEVVSKMLGHKNIATTQIYAKITNQYMQGFADALNEKL